MIVPNKVLKFKDTTINKMLFVVVVLQKNDENIHSLYEQVKHNFDGIDDFIYSLDVLFILNKIEIEWESGMVKYVS